MNIIKRLSWRQECFRTLQVEAFRRNRRISWENPGRIQKDLKIDRVFKSIWANDNWIVRDSSQGYGAINAYLYTLTIVNASSTQYANSATITANYTGILGEIFFGMRRWMEPEALYQLVHIIIAWLFRIAHGVAHTQVYFMCFSEVKNKSPVSAQ